MRLASDTVGWIAESGPDLDVVISSRARLARNLVGYRFPHRADDTERREIAGVVMAALRSDRARAWRLTEPVAAGRESVALLYSAMAQPSFGSRPSEVLAAAGNGRDFVMINEEDHIRLHHIEPGLATEECVAGAEALAQDLANRVDMAVDPELGYLSACPANTGIGLRVSVMLHAAGLAATGRLERLFRAAERLGLTARGVYGEGTRGMGHVYQISNQGAVYGDPHRTQAAVHGAADEVLDAEREARAEFVGENRDALVAATEQGARLMRPSQWVGADVANLFKAWSDLRLCRAMDLCAGPSLAELTSVLAQWGRRFGTGAGGSLLYSVKHGSDGGVG